MLLRVAAITRAKKRLGTFLVESRNLVGRSLTDAATELKTTESTVSRYESGQVLPVWSTVLTLLRYYDLGDEEHHRAVRLWEDAKDTPAPVRLPAGAHKTFRQLVNAEQEADRIRTVERSVVPGMLQREGYMRSLVEAAQRFDDPGAQPEVVTRTRLARQRRLYDDDPLALHAIIDEAVVRRHVGDTSVMRDQLEYLLTASRQPNITVQIVPFGAGAYGTTSGSSIIVDYPDDTPGVYLEYPAGGAWVENAKDVERLVAMFDDAIHAALTPTDTAELIRRRLQILDVDDQPHQVAQE